MSEPDSRLDRFHKAFLVGLVFSVVLFIAVPASTGGSGDPSTGTYILFAVALIFSSVSILGLISSQLLAWRMDRREAELDRLNLEADRDRLLGDG